MITRYECSCGEIFTDEQSCLKHEKTHVREMLGKDCTVLSKQNIIDIFIEKSVTEVIILLNKHFRDICSTLCRKEISEKCGMDSSISHNLKFLKECENKSKFNFFESSFKDEQSKSEYNVISITDSKASTIPHSNPRYKMNVGSGIFIKLYDTPLSEGSGHVILSVMFKKGMHQKIEGKNQ